MLPTNFNDFGVMFYSNMLKITPNICWTNDA